jgi:hypothetical protein
MVEFWSLFQWIFNPVLNRVGYALIASALLSEKRLSPGIAGIVDYRLI